MAGKVMDWTALTNAALQPGALRDEVVSTIQAAETARQLGHRDAAIQLIERTYAVLDLLAAAGADAISDLPSRGEATVA